jgi:hypothetical protein
LQLFGDLNVISFVRIIWLNWVCHADGKDSKRKESQVFGNNAQGSEVRGRPKNMVGLYTDRH